MIKLQFGVFDDAVIRKNFETLQAYLQANQLLEGFKFYEITLTGAVTNFKYPHHLGFTPTDLIQTSKTGPGSLTWNYSEFDGTNLDLTTTGACVVRAFVGRYVENA